MTPPPTPTPRALLLLAVLAVFAAVAAAAGPALGASPSPDPSAASSEPPPGDEPLQAWLDTAFPTDVPIGGTFRIGVTLWDGARGRLADFNELTVHLRPATGSAKPTTAKAVTDWPGHLVADIAIPRGGPGALQFGIPGTVCTSDSTCTGQEFLVPFAGTGPPADAPRSVLITASLHRILPPVLAGSPIDLIVDVAPRAAWDPAALGLPDRLVAIANHLGGPDVATAELRSAGVDGTSPTSYSGQITIPEPGDVALVFALPGNGTEDEVIARLTTRLTVEGTGEVAPSARPAPGAPAATAGGPPWAIVAVGLAVLVVAAGFLARRVFADL